MINVRNFPFKTSLLSFSAVNFLFAGFLLFSPITPSAPSAVDARAESIPIAELNEISETSNSSNQSVFMSASPPKQLFIPSINFEQPISEQLALQPSGEIEVPENYDNVGWYTLAPTPGEQGPAILLGHVSTKSGPAVFSELYRIAVGNEIQILREDGSIAIFKVYETESVPIDAFPTEKVYGNTDGAELRLITCGGDYDRSTGRFTQNTIIYAKLK